MKISFVLLGLFLVVSAHAEDFALYSPDSVGGKVGNDGSWEITDPCLASHSFLEAESN